MLRRRWCCRVKIACSEVQNSTGREANVGPRVGRKRDDVRGAGPSFTACGEERKARGQRSRTRHESIPLSTPYSTASMREHVRICDARPCPSMRSRKMRPFYVEQCIMPKCRQLDFCVLTSSDRIRMFMRPHFSAFPATPARPK